MTPCARGCCWTPYSCASNRSCPCHWDERKPTTRTGDAYVHRDPTANQAIRNVTKANNK